MYLAFRAGSPSAASVAPRSIAQWYRAESRSKALHPRKLKDYLILHRSSPSTGNLSGLPKKICARLCEPCLLSFVVTTPNNLYSERVAMPNYAIRVELRGLGDRLKGWNDPDLCPDVTGAVVRLQRSALNRRFPVEPTSPTIYRRVPHRNKASPALGMGKRNPHTKNNWICRTALMADCSYWN
jgi:hypothetical protein